jgi:hypothetical protein
VIELEAVGGAGDPDGFDVALLALGSMVLGMSGTILVWGVSEE